MTLIEARERNVFLTYKGKKVLFTTHGAERFVERNIDLAGLTFLSKKAIEHIKNNRKKFDEWAPSQYLFYSKSMNQAFVIDYKRDVISSDTENHLFVVTVLPQGRSNPKDGTTKIVVESHDSVSDIYSTHLVNYLNEVLFKNIMLESYDYEPIIIDAIEAVFVDGKFFQLNYIDIQEIE